MEYLPDNASTGPQVINFAHVRLFTETISQTNTSLCCNSSCDVVNRLENDYFLLLIRANN